MLKKMMNMMKMIIMSMISRLTVNSEVPQGCQASFNSPSFCLVTINDDHDQKGDINDDGDDIFTTTKLM